MVIGVGTDVPKVIIHLEQDSTECSKMHKNYRLVLPRLWKFIQSHLPQMEEKTKEILRFIFLSK